MLCFSYGVSYDNARYGQGYGNIVIDELQCQGWESDLTQCSSRPWLTNDCSHSEDVGVSCHGNMTWNLKVYFALQSDEVLKCYE